MGEVIRFRRRFSVAKKGIPTLPGMPVKFLTSHMLVCCNLASMRPAAFLASSVLLPASFSAQASGSVADAEAAASASQLQVEAFAVAEAAGWVALPAGDSAVALPVDDSAAVLPEDDSSQRCGAGRFGCAAGGRFDSAGGVGSAGGGRVCGRGGGWLGCAAGGRFGGCAAGGRFCGCGAAGGRFVVSGALPGDRLRCGGRLRLPEDRLAAVGGCAAGGRLSLRLRRRRTISAVAPPEDDSSLRLRRRRTIRRAVALPEDGSRLCCRRTIRRRGGRRSGLSRAASIWRVGGMASGRRRRFAGRRHLDHRMRSRGAGWTQALDLVLRQRLSGMRCQGLLLFCKRHRRRRRRPLRHHLPIHYCCRRRGHVIRSRSFRSQHALLGGNHGDPRAYGRPGNLLRVYGNCRVGDGLRARKGTLRNHRHRTLNIPVHVVHVCDVRGLLLMMVLL